MNNNVRVYIYMPIIIEAALSEPPSCVTCFRDVTLYASCLINRNVLLECSPDSQDIYWRWLKRHGAFDFIEDIIPPFSERDFSIRTDLPQKKLGRRPPKKAQTKPLKYLLKIDNDQSLLF